MSESEQGTLATPVAPETVVTATPTSEAVPPEATPDAPKTFTQEELDAIIGKRLAKEQRKWEREQAAKAAKAAPPPPSDGSLKPDQFETPEAYAEALAEHKALELLDKRERARQEAELIRTHLEREEDARERYDDYEQVAYNPALPITRAMAEAIRASDVGPDLAYHLGTNPKEAERIARLSDFLQAKEIGRLEAKLASDPPKKRTSNAPAPIAPVTARGGSEKTYDTTDPRSIGTMSTSEWIAAERARQIKKLQGHR